jgi:hypothetical protein
MRGLIKQWAWSEQRRGQGCPLEVYASEFWAELVAASSGQISLSRLGCWKRFLENVVTGKALQGSV